jgi:hypothetical protein
VRGHLVVVATMLAAAGVAAGQIVLPVFAYDLPGVGTNRWTSELYLVNRGATDATVRLAAFLPGALTISTPCLPPIAEVSVAPYSTVLWTAAAVSRDLGCPQQAIGALVLEAYGDVVVDSRMVNGSVAGAVDQGPLSGLGQEIPGVRVEDLVPAGTVSMLPGLLWHPNACGPPRFETYLYFANPGDKPATLTLMQDHDGAPGTLLLDGGAVATPVDLGVPAHGWRRVAVAPTPSTIAGCLPPQLFDLFFSADAPLAGLASVVDRSSQDARTVLPLPAE